MGYLVFCTFDLKNATAKDYQNAYADLDAIGLKRVHKTSGGAESVVPTTSAMGFFDGSDPAKVCEAIRDRVRAAFKARGLKSELFIVTGENWAWVASTT